MDRWGRHQRAADRRGAPLPVEYAIMDAHGLDFPDGAFDLYWTERVLREIARVLRPGGRVVGRPL